MKKILRSIYYSVKSRIRILKVPYWFLLNLAYTSKLLTIYKIPIVINNYNRLTFLLKLIEFLENCGYKNIIILDNNSSYPPLLKFYKECKYKIIGDGNNYGHLAFWKSNLYNKYKWNYFVYTDSDVVPVDECPKDFIEYFRLILNENCQLDKIGFGIKIDDLPDSFSYKKEVVDYEKKYWEKEVMPNIYNAPIDTTFALYKPFSNLKAGQIYTLTAFRLGFPYLIRHLPWYVDSQHLSAEEDNYLQTCNAFSSIGKQKMGNAKVY